MSAYRTEMVVDSQPIAVQETKQGYRIKVGDLEVLIPTDDALRVWLKLGLLLDNHLDGQLNVATSGGLGALRTHYLAHLGRKEGD